MNPRLLGKRQSLHDHLGHTGRHVLVLAVAALLLRALARKKVTLAGASAHDFTGTGNFEAFGDGLFCFLHVENREKEEPTKFHQSCKERIGKFRLQSETRKKMEPAMGLEPTTYGLQNRCSAN